MSGGSRQPFIMPDGRPLGAFLESDGQRAGADATRKRGSAKSRKHGGRHDPWERAFRAAAPAGAAPLSEADQIELEAISKVGRERRRRWLNDKILRDMAGAMTAADMDGLFKPPPFGGPAARPTALSATALPENVPIWDLFRNIDMEKQHRVLIRWEQHVAEQRAANGGGGGTTAPSPALHALQAWASTSRKARDALRRASLDVVHALEVCILREVLGVLPPDNLAASTAAQTPGTAAGAPPAVTSGKDPAADSAAASNAEGETQPAAACLAAAAASDAGAGAGGELCASPAAPGTPLKLQHAQQRGHDGGESCSELQLSLPDGFHRLLVHGLAQFHGLASFSRDAVPAGDAAEDGVPPGSCPTPSGGSPPDASSDARGRITVVRQQPQRAETWSPAAEDLITVSDVLLVMDLAGGSGNLTAAMLEVPPTPDSRAELWADAPT